MSVFVPETFPEHAAYWRTGVPGMRDTAHPPHAPY